MPSESRSSRELEFLSFEHCSNREGTGDKGAVRGGADRRLGSSTALSSGGALTFGDIEVEEVTVEQRLHTASDDGYDVIEAFVVVPPYPVDKVEGPVRAESK